LFWVCCVRTSAPFSACSATDERKSVRCCASGTVLRRAQRDRSGTRRRGVALGLRREGGRRHVDWSGSAAGPRRFARGSQRRHDPGDHRSHRVGAVRGAAVDADGEPAFASHSASASISPARAGLRSSRSAFTSCSTRRRVALRASRSPSAASTTRRRATAALSNAALVR
jgi:hypothetical protein